MDYAGTTLSKLFIMNPIVCVQLKMMYGGYKFCPSMEAAGKMMFGAYPVAIWKIKQKG